MLAWRGAFQARSGAYASPCTRQRQTNSLRCRRSLQDHNSWLRSERNLRGHSCHHHVSQRSYSLGRRRRCTRGLRTGTHLDHSRWTTSQTWLLEGPRTRVERECMGRPLWPLRSLLCKNACIRSQAVTACMGFRGAASDSLESKLDERESRQPTRLKMHEPGR